MASVNSFYSLLFLFGSFSLKNTKKVVENMSIVEKNVEKNVKNIELDLIGFHLINASKMRSLLYYLDILQTHTEECLDEIISMKEVLMDDTACKRIRATFD